MSFRHSAANSTRLKFQAPWATGIFICCIALGLGAFAAPITVHAQTLWSFSPGSNSEPISTSGNFINASCTLCVTGASPSNGLIGETLSITAFSMVPVAQLAADGSVDYQQFEGPCPVTLENSSTDAVLSGECNPFTIYAAPGASTAVFQFEFSTFASDLGASGPLYMIVAGTTAAPVGTVTNTMPADFTSFANISLNSWYGIISTSPYSPGGFTTVPDLTNFTQTAATLNLGTDGLAVGGVTQQPSTTVAAGSVISTVPASGATIADNWPVNLIVSSGLPPVLVPDVSSTQNILLGAAVSELKSDNLTAGTVTGQTDSAPAGTVIGQSPAAGTSVAAFTPVTLTVSAGPGPFVSPNVRYSGDGTSSFNYTFYASPVAGGTYAEAFLSAKEYNQASPYYFFANSAGAYDASANAALWELTYEDQTSPIQCAPSQCDQKMMGSGTLTIVAVNTCPTSPSGPIIGLTNCDWTQGTLGAGIIYAGNSLASLQGGSVNNAAIQMTYQQTETYSVADQVAVLTPYIPPGYVILSGASGQNTYTDNRLQFVPAAMPLCYLDMYGGCQSTPLSGETPYFNEFGVDWAGAISPSPWGAQQASESMSVRPLRVSFGDEEINDQSLPAVITVTNTGEGSLTVSPINLTGASQPAFSITTTCGAALASGASCTISVRFKPHTPVMTQDSIFIGGGAAGSRSVNLSGTGGGTPNILVSSTSLPAFSAELLGYLSAGQTVTITSTGSANLNIRSVAITGKNPSSFIQTNTCGSSVPPIDTCTITAIFDPLATGALTASLSIVSDATATPVYVTMSGTGQGAILNSNPASVQFGSQALGTPSVSELMLINRGNIPLTVYGVTVEGANPASFTSSNTCSSAIAAGGSCSMSVIFTPKSSGPLTADLKVVSNATGSPARIPLSGTGL